MCFCDDIHNTAKSTGLVRLKVVEHRSPSRSDLQLLRNPIDLTTNWSPTVKIGDQELTSISPRVPHKTARPPRETREGLVFEFCQSTV